MFSRLKLAGDAPPRQQSVASKKAGTHCSAELFLSGISINGNVRAPASAFSPQRAPIDCRIENERAADGCPLEPSVGLATGCKTFTDNKSDVLHSSRMHLVVKRNGFALA